MSRSDRIALLFSLLAVLAAFLVHDRIFERLAHLEDEMAYLWQAQVIAGGELTLPTPPSPKSFLYPFVVDYDAGTGSGSQRFGKYPLGWPVVLALGEVLGVRFLVNPLLAGFGIWLIYLLGKRLFSETVGLLAAGLTLTSPFFLINSGSLLSHPLGLVLSAAFTLAWIDSFTSTPAQNSASPSGLGSLLPVLAGGGALGLLAISRPFTALSVVFPFGLHGLYLLARGGAVIRRRLILMALVALAIGTLYFLWQYAVTGDALLNPYTLWWKYDKVGFGPGVGRISGGHTLNQAWVNTRFNIFIGRHDLFGWARFSWIFLPVGLLAILRDRNWRALLPTSVFASLFVFYQAYWIGAWIFGPRYYYEGLFSLTLLSAAGIALLAGWSTHIDPKTGPVAFPEDVLNPKLHGWRKLRPLLVTAGVSILMAMNLIFYVPGRLEMLRGLYGVNQAAMRAFQTASAQSLSPALIIVHTTHSWIEYGTLLELETPFLNTPFIFVYSRGPEVDTLLGAHYPERTIYHYYPTEQPYILFNEARPPN